MKPLPKILFVILSFHIVACSNDMEVLNKIINPEEEPDLFGKEVKMAFSDSAILQMRLEAPIIKEFNTSDKPRREFPKGVHVWFYEKDGSPKGDIRADSAWYNADTEIWEAIGNVELTSADGQVLFAQQLFWNTKEKLVYTDKYAKITRPNGSISEGHHGIRATQDFQVIDLYNTNHELIFEENNNPQTDIK